MTLARFIAKESIVIDGRRLVFERRSKDRTKLIFTDPETLEPVVLDEKKVVEKLFRESETTRSEEHTSELQSLMRISYAVFCLKKQKNNIQQLKQIYDRIQINEH